jgi:hypothetical protein
MALHDQAPGPPSAGPGSIAMTDPQLWALMPPTRIRYSMLAEMTCTMCSEAASVVVSACGEGRASAAGQSKAKHFPGKRENLQAQSRTPAHRRRHGLFLAHPPAAALPLRRPCKRWTPSADRPGR